MSAELLRRAAAEMRKKAETATPGDWNPWGHAEPEEGCRCMSCYEPSWSWEIDKIDGPDCLNSSDCLHVMHIKYEDADYISSWHPAVAMAVADWLDETADSWDLYGGSEGAARDAVRFAYIRALDVARAYLRIKA